MSASRCGTRGRALRAWLVRGGIGLVLLAMAASTRHLVVAVPALLAALTAFGGCPMCWVFGLIERGAQELTPRSPKDTP
ncbi:MAG: hypothetical protein AB7O67_18685 [Vicinamibacterales bacterium]